MNDIMLWLERAAAWRWASLAFQSPSETAHAELRAVADELPLAERERAQALASIPLETWEQEFHRVLGPGGCPASESSYDDNALAGRGPLLAVVAGCYGAFGYRPSDAGEVPDHIAVVLGFLAYLAVKVAFAEYLGRPVERDVAREAYGRFLEDHVRYWVSRLGERLAEAESPFYAEAVERVRALAVSEAT
jgi:TorA maturation chaperone TorD